MYHAGYIACASMQARIVIISCNERNKCLVHVFHHNIIGDSFTDFQISSLETIQ